MTSGHWWAVEHEVTVASDKPMAARVGDQALALFKDASGAVRAVEDECAHRRAPLSLGGVTRAGLIQCPYHGWSYDGASGKCRAIPNLSADEKVPEHFGIRAFETSVKEGFVFVRTADADPSQKPVLTLGVAGAQHSRRRNANLPYPHFMYAALLLDRPSAIVSISGVTILDDYRWGDPFFLGEEIVSEFGATWSKPKTMRLPTTPPLTIRLGVARGTAAAHIHLRDDTGKILSAAFIAAVPHGGMVTRLSYIEWTEGHPDERIAEMAIRPQLDVADILAARPAALPLWQKT